MFTKQIKMLKSLLTLSIVLLLCCTAMAQSYPTPTPYDTVITYYKANSDNSVYTVMQKIWDANRSISYFALPTAVPIEERPIALQEGEGKNGYVFEANLDQSFILKMGRNQQNNRAQTRRWTFDAAFNLRMARDASNPLLPSSNRVGIGFDKIFYNSYCNWRDLRGLSGRQSEKLTENFVQKEKPLHVWYISGHAMHYSNGQPPGFYLDSTIRRNDYLEGDFSTNFLRGTLTYSYLARNRNLLTINAGYQWDSQWSDFFRFAPEMVNSYGQHRVIGYVQYRFLGTTNKVRKWADYRYNPQLNLKLKRYWELRSRLEFEYILDEDLSNFRHANKHRLNTHLYFQFSYLNWRTFGLMAHFFYGRDYLNVRYDDIVFSSQFGVTFNLNKYVPPFSNNQILANF